MGVLPEVAGDLQVTIPQAGQLVSAYALGVVVGAPLLAVVTARLPRKALLLALVSALVLGNALSALAPDFGSLALARFASGLPHGAYFGTASIVAASLVPPARRARAVARVMLGLTVSNVVGVPLATLLGQQFGWRSTYALVAVDRRAGGRGGRAARCRRCPRCPGRAPAESSEPCAARRSG